MTCRLCGKENCGWKGVLNEIWVLTDNVQLPLSGEELGMMRDTKMESTQGWIHDS